MGSGFECGMRIGDCGTGSERNAFIAEDAERRAHHEVHEEHEERPTAPLAEGTERAERGPFRRVSRGETRRRAHRLVSAAAEINRKHRVVVLCVSVDSVVGSRWLLPPLAGKLGERPLLFVLFVPFAVSSRLSFHGFTTRAVRVEGDDSREATGEA